jgi:hypothetical protein
LVLGPETFTRGPGAPPEELRTFSLAEPGAICLLVDNQGTSSARIELDGVALLTPNELTTHIRQLTVMANVVAGNHELLVKLASSPGSTVTAEVRFAQTDITPTGRVVGDKGKVAVWGLADTPDPFSPANHNGIKDVTTLSAVAQVLHLDGAPSFLYGLHYVFQVTDPATCRQIRTLAGYLPLDPAVHLAGIPISAQWDGRDDSGDLVPEGTYYYRVVVSLVRRNAGGMGHSLDTATSLVQTVTIDNDPQVDEPDLVTLEEVPEEIVQALPPFDVSTPFEVDVPVAETSPEGDEGGNGDRGAKCYPAACDYDKDGYASADNLDCKRQDLTPEETGGKGLCPDGWVQYHEPHECDQIVTGQDEVDFWRYRVRPDMAQHWLTRFTLAGYWISNYAKHRPRRPETPDNYLDDNCNGLIDETEFMYWEYQLLSAPGQIMLRVRVNDQKIRQNANVIVAHVFDLADIECPIASQEVKNNPAIKALEVGELSYTHSGLVYTLAPSVVQGQFLYWGEREFQIEINGLPQGTGAYAVALTYHRLAITSWDPIEVDFWQLKCIGLDGAITSDTTCTKAGRIASNVYFTVIGRSSVPEEKLRKLVANSALHEWHLSEYTGLVGGPRSATAAWPDGTHYYADYGELWCTEFPAAIYRWTLLDSWPFGYATNVAGMAGYFRNRGWLDEGDQARDNMSILDPALYGALGPARPGDYLALATYEEDEKNHSSLFLWNSGVDGNWKIGGNEDRRVKLKCSDNYRIRYEHYVYKVLGHISELEPIDNGS